jgi:hypothetical protein
MILTLRELLLLGEYYKKSKYFKNALNTVGFCKRLIRQRLDPNLCQRTSLSLPTHLSKAANTPLHNCASIPLALCHQTSLLCQRASLFAASQPLYACSQIESGAVQRSPSPFFRQPTSLFRNF